ncbi:MAG TPA: glycosyltransferase family 2 protein [Bacteroidales bacterium]|nr:glycosyltransferase family 2 protein [Bacteroidales bacterium]
MVAIITINYNLHIHTIQCVNSVLDSDYTNLMVFVIDNGSVKGDYQILVNAYSDNPKVQVFRIEKNCGYVRGVNYGLEISARELPDYYLIMNNDTIIDKSAITELVNVAKRHNNQAIVSGKVYYYDHPDILQHTGVMFTDKRYLTTYYPGRNEKDTGQCDIESERDSLDDVFWLLPYGLVQDVGLYCDYFFLYAEQGDYARRAKNLGYKLIYTPHAKLWHKESMTAGDGNPKALPVYYYRGQGRFVFQFRHLKTKYFVQITLKNLFTIIARIVLRTGYERKKSIALLRGYLWGFKWMFYKKPNSGYNPYLRRYSPS